MDETGVLWQARGEKSKKRVTVAFFVSAAGVKEKPILIWKSETPRCLAKFDKSVPVDYYRQKAAWMTGTWYLQSLTDTFRGAKIFLSLLTLPQSYSHLIWE